MQINNYPAFVPEEQMPMIDHLFDLDIVIKEEKFLETDEAATRLCTTHCTTRCNC